MTYLLWIGLNFGLMQMYLAYKGRDKAASFLAASQMTLLWVYFLSRAA